MVDWIKVRKTSWVHRQMVRMPFYEDLYIFRRGRAARRLGPAIKRSMDALLYSGTPLYRVEFDTANRCNRDCPFCAQSASRYREPLKVMGMPLFIKILRDLRSMDYRRTIVLSCQFEPFMDPQIVERARLVREHLPNAHPLMLYTNGTMLGKYHNIMRYLDLMVIDNYGDGKTLNPAVMKIVGEMSGSERDRTVIWLRLEDEVLDSISGMAPNRRKLNSLPTGCTCLFSEMRIGPDGRVGLCSKDVSGRTFMGNCENSTIQEIWHGKNFSDARLAFLKDGRQGMDLCKTCDFIRTDYDETSRMATHWFERVKVEEVEP